MSSTVEGLERGVAGTTATIEKMHKLVALGKLDPTMQKIAYWIRLSIPQDRRGSTKDTADAIFNWTSKHGVFTRDPFQAEKLEEPIVSMAAVVQAKKAGTYRGPGLFMGDCDTFAIMTATLGGILGFQYAFETAKVDASRPDEFSHVWSSLLVDDGWYSLDSSTRGAYPGWHPPVNERLLARWPEKPIESVIGRSDMHNITGGGLLGEFGEDLEPDSSDDRNGRSPLADVDAEYPKDYIGYGIPRDFGAGPGVVPPGNFDDLQLLPPHDTQIPDADLQPDMHVLKAAPRLDPSERIQHIDGQPDDHGNPYYRTSSGPQPYFKVERQFYPPGSRWNGQMGHDAVRYVKTGAYVQVKSPETPERQVRVDMGQPMLARRRTVMVAPRRVPFGAMEGYGLGDEDMPDPIQPDDSSGFVTSLTQPAPTVQDTSVVSSLPGYNPNAPAGSTGSIAVKPTALAPKTPTTAAAAAAGGSVWDSISSIFGAAGKIAPAVMQSQAAQAVINATNKLAGRQVLGAGVVMPWYKNPVVLGAGALVLGGGAYIVMKMRPGSGGRRRR